MQSPILKAYVAIAQDAEQVSKMRLPTKERLKTARTALEERAKRMKRAEAYLAQRAKRRRLDMNNDGYPDGQKPKGAKPRKTATQAAPVRTMHQSKSMQARRKPEAPADTGYARQAAPGKTVRAPDPLTAFARNQLGFGGGLQMTAANRSQILADLFRTDTRGGISAILRRARQSGLSDARIKAMIQAKSRKLVDEFTLG